MILTSRIATLLIGSWLMIIPPTTTTSLHCHDGLDFRHTHEYIQIGSNTYHYLLSPPSNNATDARDTIFLVHGFPDLSHGWRYQIPYLNSLGYQIVAPDMLGYGRSSAPYDINNFSLKHMSDDLATLIRKVVGDNQQVILGGHDWGGAMVYRAALWEPELYKGIFSVCTPFFPPATEYVDLKDQIDAGITPTFGYQLQLRDPAIDARLRGVEKIRQVLLALYGATTPAGEAGFDARTGLIFESLPNLGSSPLVSDDEIDYYVGEYLKNTMRGPLSWYRTAKINFDDELPLATAGNTSFSMPGLYIAASMDTALPPELSEGMEAYFGQGLTRGEVESSHWAPLQAAEGVNKIVGEWLAGLD